jgi:hypothetical protein
MGVSLGELGVFSAISAVKSFDRRGRRENFQKNAEETTTDHEE